MARTPIPPPPASPRAIPRAQWLSRQSKQRRYAVDVLGVIERLRTRFAVVEYGRIEYGPDTYPLLALKTRDWRDALPIVLVTGGVHGYETNGVHGALLFFNQQAEAWAGPVNLLAAPCADALAI